MLDAVRSLSVLGATIGGVAIITLGLAGLVAPRATARLAATPTPQPTFDIGVVPTIAGGRLEITGDRSGTLVLDAATGSVGYQQRKDGMFTLVLETAFLTGPDGRVGFDPNKGEITQIEFEDLAFYVDPGECTVTTGEQNPESGLMSVLLECQALPEVRDKGVFSVAGVVAVPSSVFRTQAHLPPPGGTVEIGARMLHLVGAIGMVSAGRIDESGETIVGMTVHTPGTDSFIALEVDLDTGEWRLTGGGSDDDFVEVAGDCPAETEELGVLNEWTTVMRFTFDCADVAPSAGEDGSVTGSVIVDVIEESQLPAP